ncbi:MAG: MBL fold metallo-hydrolase [Thermodesulfobacteriota bacterium]
MKFCVLGSGSSGNATFVTAGGQGLLIDAGFSGKELARRCDSVGLDLARLRGLLITHEHNDHIKGAGVVSRRYKVPLLINRPTFVAAGQRLGRVEHLHHFNTGEDFSFHGFTIHPFAVSHDTAEPVGFIIEHDGYRLGYCTDTGMVSRLLQHRLAGCHGLVLECNHDPDLLADGPYPPQLKQRVRSKMGHLANGEAAAFIADLLHPGLQHVVLAHLSDTNNRPELALDEVMGVLASRKNGSMLPEISLAWQERSGHLVDLGQP